MSINWYDIIGYLAAFCIVCYTFPQVFDTIKYKDTSKINIYMYILIFCGALCFFIDGVGIITCSNNPTAGLPLAIPNAINTLTCSFILIYKLINMYQAKKANMSEKDFCNTKSKQKQHKMKEGK